MRRIGLADYLLGGRNFGEWYDNERERNRKDFDKLVERMDSVSKADMVGLVDTSGGYAVRLSPLRHSHSIGDGAQEQQLRRRWPEYDFTIAHQGLVRSDIRCGQFGNLRVSPGLAQGIAAWIECFRDGAVRAAPDR